MFRIFFFLPQLLLRFVYEGSTPRRFSASIQLHFMSTSSVSVGLLNPDIYLNHLPPAEAKQLEISRNILVVVLGVSNLHLLSFTFTSLIDFTCAGYHLGCIGLCLGRYKDCEAQQTFLRHILFYCHKVTRFMRDIVCHGLKLIVLQTISYRLRVR